MSRATVAADVVNELRLGFSNAPVYFADSVDLDHFADQGGFDIAFPNIGSALTGATTNRAPSSRNGKSWNLDNTVNWIAGRHSLQFGESFTRTSGWTTNQTLVPQLTLGVDTANDPANAMFTPATTSD